MLFKCDVCEYTSNKQYNVKRHAQLRHVDGKEPKTIRTVCRFCSKQFTSVFNCTRHENSSCTSQINCNSNISENLQNVMNCSNVISDTSSLTHQCETCYKTFSSKYKLIDHKPKCKKIEHPFQCIKCKKVLSSRQAKSKHIKICQHDDKVQVVEDLPINGTTSNHNCETFTTEYSLNDQKPVCKPKNECNIRPDINDFGQETVNVFTTEVLMQESIYTGVGILALIRKMHFNKDHPENSNIRKGNNKNTLVVRENGEWVSHQFEEKYDEIWCKYVNILYKFLDTEGIKCFDTNKRTKLYGNLKKIDQESNPNVYYSILRRFRFTIDTFIA